MNSEKKTAPFVSIGLRRDGRYGCKRDIHVRERRYQLDASSSKTGRKRKVLYLIERRSSEGKGVGGGAPCFRLHKKEAPGKV